MLNYTLRRLGIAIPTLFIIVTAAFFLMRLAPGGPFDAEADLEPEVLENIRASYDLDKPLLTQYRLFLQRAVRGDFGPSLVYKDYSVTELIAIGLPVSIQLGLLAKLLALVLGCTGGIVAALRQNTTVDHAVMAMAMTGIALPAFVTAPILALVFGLYLKLLPVAGWDDGAWRNLVLPVVALALPQVAVIARLMRGGMLEVLRASFVRTARARGLGEARIVTRHVLPTALIPLVGYLGPALAGIMTGSLVIELIFNLPGVGRYFVQGALNRDYPLVMGIVIVYATFIILFNLLSDLAYAGLDPRVRKAYR
ncbi:MAG: oligopeptide ABC transporter permease OppB [Chromatiales bacterium]|jgi:oligopeptide transport system permease protein|nr:oligopeptide ABC transporter permease OppB [Chromatiales bacterium]